MDLSEAIGLINQHNATLQKALADGKDLKESYLNFNMRLVALEQQRTGANPGAAQRAAPAESAGFVFAKSLDLAELRKHKTSGAIAVPRFFTRAIAPDLATAGTIAQLPPAMVPAWRPLLRNYLNVVPMSTTSFQFAREEAFTNAAFHGVPEALRARGALVFMLNVYETLDREIKMEELARLDAADPGIIVFHSPSAVEAVYSSAAPGSVRRWQKADLVAIGSTTLASCRGVRSDRIWECREPSDAALVTLITSMTNKVTEEKRA
jgi:hypothetical protein